MRGGGGGGGWRDPSSDRSEEICRCENASAAIKMNTTNPLIKPLLSVHCSEESKRKTGTKFCEEWPSKNHKTLVKRQALLTTTSDDKTTLEAGHNAANPLWGQAVRRESEDGPRVAVIPNRAREAC